MTAPLFRAIFGKFLHFRFMQTLGLSKESTPRSEGRLKSLFWPSIQNAHDVDYLGAQGYWLCTFVAVVSLALGVATGQPFVWVLGVLYLLVYLSGVGIREHSRYAAAAALLWAVANVLISPGVLAVLFAALMLSNLRATWIASGWKPASEEAAPPPRLGETWTDKFADRFPSWLWPKVRIPYYVVSVCFVVLVFVGMAAMISRGTRRYGNSGIFTRRPGSSHVVNDSYLAVRNQVLQGSRTTFGLPASPDSTTWGVLMEWGISNGTATLLVLSDLSASVYFSNGSGYLGGASQAIRKAAESTVNVAGEFQPQMHLTATYPLPKRGEVIFYLLTDGGVLTASASEEDLKNNRLPLSRLRNTATGLVTLVVQESKHGSGP
jgi:hypothetical protein